MSQNRQKEPAQSSSMLAPTQEYPLSHVESTSRQSRYQRIMAALRPQSSTSTVTTVPESIYTSTTQAPAPARPHSSGTTATNTTTDHIHNWRARLHRFFHRSHHHTHSHHNRRLFSSLSVPHSLHHRHGHHHRDSNDSSPASTHHFSRSRSHSHSSYDGGDYDPYTVRGTTPPPTGPRDFAATSQQSGVWQRGQRRERRPEPDDGTVSSDHGVERWVLRGRGGQSRRRGRCSMSTSMSSSGRSPTTATSMMTSDDGMEFMTMPINMDYGYAHGHGYQESWEVDVHASGSMVGAHPHQRASHRLHGPRPPPSRHGHRRRSQSGSTYTTTTPPTPHHAGTSFNLSFSHVGPDYRRSRSVVASHASSDVRSRSASSVYSRGTHGDGGPSYSSAYSDNGEGIHDDNAEEEADEADTSGIPSRPRRPSASRSHSHASSLALRRWESSHPGSPYPSPFRPGLAALSRPRPAQAQQTEWTRRQKGRAEEGSGSIAIAAVSTIADDDGEDDAYAEALAGSAMASTPPPLAKGSGSGSRLRQCEVADKND